MVQGLVGGTEGVEEHIRQPSKWEARPKSSCHEGVGEEP